MQARGYPRSAPPCPGSCRMSTGPFSFMVPLSWCRGVCRGARATRPGRPGPATLIGHPCLLLAGLSKVALVGVGDSGQLAPEEDDEDRRAGEGEPEGRRDTGVDGQRAADRRAGDEAAEHE